MLYYSHCYAHATLIYRTYIPWVCAHKGNIMQKTLVALKKTKRDIILGIVGIVVILVAACGGGNTTQQTGKQETPSNLVGTKDPVSGITYTKTTLIDPVSDKDADNDGVPDRVMEKLKAIYKGDDATTTAKIEALRGRAKVFTRILDLDYTELPKTKEEAIKIVYPEEAYANYCAFDKAFSITETENASNHNFFLNMNTRDKVKRLREIERLAGYKSLSRDCHSY